MSVLKQKVQDIEKELQELEEETEKENFYECQICLAMFSQSVSLKIHIASVHEGKKL